MNEQLKAAEDILAGLSHSTHAIPLGPHAPVVEGGFAGMNKTDWIVCGPRERVGAVLRGANPERLADGNAGARPYKVAPSSDAPGSRALKFPTGTALSHQQRTDRAIRHLPYRSRRRL